MTNTEIIEHWWDDHSLTDTGWMAYLPKQCWHKNIRVKDFNRWECADCGLVASYEELRK
jgi:hypothetical protein